MHHTLEDDLTVSGSLLQGIAPCGAVLFGGSMRGGKFRSLLGPQPGDFVHYLFVRALK